MLATKTAVSTFASCVNRHLVVAVILIRGNSSIMRMLASLLLAELPAVFDSV